MFLWRNLKDYSLQFSTDVVKDMNNLKFEKKNIKELFESMGGKAPKFLTGEFVSVVNIDGILGDGVSKYLVKIGRDRLFELGFNPNGRGYYFSEVLKHSFNNLMFMGEYSKTELSSYRNRKILDSYWKDIAHEIINNEEIVGYNSPKLFKEAVVTKIIDENTFVTKDVYNQYFLEKGGENRIFGRKVVEYNLRRIYDHKTLETRLVEETEFKLV